MLMSALIRILLTIFVTTSTAFAQERLALVNFEQHIGAPVPRSTVFRDDQGTKVALGSYLGRGRPIILSMAYFHCETLCPLVLNGILKATNEFDAAKRPDFEVLVVSIDPRDTPTEAATRKRTFLARTRLDLQPDQVHFLTGSVKSIDELAEALGFRYRFDPQSGQYEHPSGLMILTGSGLISRYFFGIEYDAQDLDQALKNASRNSLGQTLKQWVLACYRFNSNTGVYTEAIYWTMRALAVVLLVGGGLMLYRWEQRRVQAK